MSAPVVTGPADGSTGGPDGESDGRFGRFGGRMMPEALMASLSVREPDFTETTSAPSRCIRATLRACRSVSTSPM
jgi:hypothetical protein